MRLKIMTEKEQIIIDGEKEDCKILFRCKHIDDLAAYNMIRNGIKITPENAPIGDFELMLIENTDSPFGFSSVCKRNNKEDVWEYSEFGHSGACSIVTALLKRLARKTQECEQKEKELLSNEKIINKLMKEVDELKQECEEYKKRAVCFKDVNKQLGYKYLTIKQECEELKKQLETSEKWRIKAESLNENFELKNTCYRKALEEIEEVIKTPCAEDCVYYELSRCYDCIKTSILDITSKAKGE